MAEEIGIVGAGPAGTACAVQLKRLGFSPVLFEGAEIGGTVRQASLVENYPGFPTGITGLDFADLLKNQIVEWSIPVIGNRVNEVDFKDGSFIFNTGGSPRRFRCVVIAAGSTPIELPSGIVGEDCGDLIFYDVLKALKQRPGVCAVIGGGDVAVDWAVTMAGISEVHLLHRKPEPSCLGLLLKKASKVGVAFERAELLSLERAGDQLRINLDSGTLQVDALLPAIGRVPVKILGEGVLNWKNRLVASGRLHLVGDFVNGRMRQVAIAAGDGLRAALEIASQ